jgi:hypothetical protein
VPRFTTTNNAVTLENSTLLNTGGGLLVQGGGAYDFGQVSSGTRLMWIPQRAAFRAGVVTGSEWDPGNIGENSVAMGENTISTGRGSVALGRDSRARGQGTTALGNSAFAREEGATALGWAAIANGKGSLALGTHVYALGNYSAVIGTFATTSRTPQLNRESLDQQGSNNGYAGNFMITDGQGGDGGELQGSGSVEAPGRFLFAERDHQFTARFSGGYRLFTNSAASVGVRLESGANSWSTLSDERRKENFKPVNGEAMLEKISRFRLTTWNYRGQDARQYRHYGPMAQDFFAAFGNDGIGVIGNDTTINAADFDGINFAAIKALVDRTEQLRQKDREMEALLRQLKAEHDRNEQLQAELSAQQKRTQKLESDLEMIKVHVGLSPQGSTGSGRRKDKQSRKDMAVSGRPVSDGPVHPECVPIFSSK